MIFAAAIDAAAQNKPVKKTAVAVNNDQDKDEKLYQIPMVSGAGFDVRLNADGKMTAKIISDEDSDLTSISEFSKIYNDLSQMPGTAAKAGVKKYPVILLSADDNVPFSVLTTFIDRTRKNDRATIKIRSNGVDLIIVPGIDTRRTPPPPDPLSLFLTIMPKGNFVLNGLELGSISEPSLLKNKLKDIFADREKYGIFRPGSNDVEKTISLNISPSILFSELKQAASILRESGSDRSYLGFTEGELIMEIEASPVSKPN